MANVILQTNIPGTNATHGKVRDIYDLGDKLLFVASDRISAFDRIMKTGIPYKGQILTQISKFWFELLADVVENHLITDDVSKYPAPFCDHADQLAGRSMLVKKTKVLPVECVIRCDLVYGRLGILSDGGNHARRDFLGHLASLFSILMRWIPLGGGS